METILSDDFKHSDRQRIKLKRSPTVKKITSSEFARIVSVRVSELENNEPTFLPANFDLRGLTLKQIAEAEIKNKLCPYIIIREIKTLDPSVIYYEEIKVNDCIIFDLIRKIL
jgi:DNA-directed RNA polymerase subunit K/omega